MGNSNKYSGKELSKHLKEGDLKAYNILFDTYFSRIFNYALKLSNDDALAKDIVQDTFVKLWTKREQINIELSIGNYLYKICKNEFLGYLRDKKKERAFLDEIKIETTYQMHLEPEDNVARINRLRAAIEKLSPKCKEAFILSKYENLSYKDIAEKMNISIKTVEVHISKAYSQLRKGLMSFLMIWF